MTITAQIETGIIDFGNGPNDIQLTAAWGKEAPQISHALWAAVAKLPDDPTTDQVQEIQEQIAHKYRVTDQRVDQISSAFSNPPEISTQNLFSMLRVYYSEKFSRNVIEQHTRDQLSTQGNI